MSTEGTANTIGEVIIRSQPLFGPTDPAENHFPYRLVNRLHTPTRESVVRAHHVDLLLLLRRAPRICGVPLVVETSRNF